MAHIDTTARSVVIDGQKKLLVAGAVHYWRSTPEQWPELLRRSREAGINTIQTYVFWGIHENEQGKFDFEGRYDLKAFCQAVHDAGMYLIIRLGPYMCGEVNYGGFPVWLRDVPGIQFRTWNRPFMDKMEKWIREVGELIRPFSPDNGGPLILAEIENEYDQMFPIYGEDGRAYMEWAIELGHSLDLGVPLLTCGSLKNALPTLHGFAGNSKLDDFQEAYPDMPPLWTEHWPGWFNTFGHAPRLRSPESVAHGTAQFFAKGGAGVSYYMWHAGTNFQREGMFLQCPQYGFEAPLDEYGYLSTKGHHLSRLHRVLFDYHDTLVDDLPRREQLNEGVELCSYGGDEAGVHFVSNSGPAEKQMRLCGHEFELLPQSTVILTPAEGVLFDSARVAPSDQVTYKYVSSVSFADTFSARSEVVPSGTRTPVAVREEPREQLQWTQDKTDYCWYVADVDIEREGPGVLSLTRVADFAYVFVDGELRAQTTPPLTEGRGDPRTPAFTQQFNISLLPGRHEIAVLCCGLGLVKHDGMLNMCNMVEERKGLWGAVLWKGVPIKTEWRIYPGLSGEHKEWYRGKEEWAVDNTVSEPRMPCWWRTRFRHPGEEGPFVLDLKGMSKGLAWVNGHCIGRYWQVPAVGHLANDFVVQSTDQGPTGIPTQRYYHVPSSWLGEDNVLVLLEEQGASPNDGSVGLRKVVYAG